MLESVEAHLPKSFNSYFKKKLYIKQTNKQKGPKRNRLLTNALIN